ncbi:MAG: hypothetical protein ACSHX8_14935 [Opitutaceae bacterium]
MRFYLIGFVLFLASVGTVSAQQETFTKQRALQRFTEAYGGERDATVLSSVRIVGKLEQGGKQFDFFLRKKRPNSIRYRIDHEDVSVIAGFDGVVGWMQTKRGSEVETRKLTRKELRTLKKQSEFESPLFRHLEKRAYKIEMTGRERVEGRDTFVFEVKQPDGSRMRYYMDAFEPHILRHELLDDSGAVVLTTVYRDYRDVEGYPFAFDIETRKGDEVIALVKIESIAANPGLLSFYFKMPK